MRVDLDRYRAVHRSIRLRSVIVIIIGALILMFGDVWMVGMAMARLVGRQQIWDSIYAPTIGTALGLCPCIIGVVLVVWGITGIAKMGRLREIATVARHTPHFTTEDVARGLGVNARRAG